MSDKSALTPRGRVSYPTVFTARAGTNDDGTKGEPKFSMVLIFDQAAQATPEFKAMQAAAIEAAKAKFGADKQFAFGEAQYEKMIAAGGDPKKIVKLRNPFRNGAEKDQDGYGVGTVYINMSSKMKPQLIDQRKNPIEDETEFYAGCYARASYSAYGYDAKGNKGVSFGLRNVQKLAEGEPLGSRTRAVDDFDSVADDVAADSAAIDNMFG